MSTGKHIDKICIAVLILVLAATGLLMAFAPVGESAEGSVMGYEDKLFDDSRVHSLDIRIDDWDGFISTCTDEAYTLCDLSIDGEVFSNVGLRAKGNTSLSSVEKYGSDRYSFKVEFDHYSDGLTYYGLDKLCLNNLIQDNTCMKDYICYKLMSLMDVPSPLCSYVYVTVNGEDFGLYLAVEGVEEAFTQRSFSDAGGELYKPDSSEMGGGPGNGKDFDVDALPNADSLPSDGEAAPDGNAGSQAPADTDSGTQDQAPAIPGGDMNGTPPAAPDGTMNGTPPAAPDGSTNATQPAAPGDGSADNDNNGSAGGFGGDFAGRGDDFGGGFGGRPGADGSGTEDGRSPGAFSEKDQDVSLIYSDDDFESYSNIFDNAKTDLTDADKKRLISALKALNEQTDLEDTVDVESVIKYFVVHNFVLNFDSYTGGMIHNYYLYENDGQLTMIPWDYNLAFGAFQSGTDAGGLINYPIDTPTSGNDTSSRPMLSWIFSSDEYTEKYHQYFDYFISSFFENGYFEKTVTETAALIAPYVEKDPTKFCTYEEFEKGVSTLIEFCGLRAESVRAQLSGEIASTKEGQAQTQAALVDAGDININDMGSMGMGGGPGNGKDSGSGSLPNADALPDADAAAPDGNAAPDENSGSQVPADNDGGAQGQAPVAPGGEA